MRTHLLSNVVALGVALAGARAFAQADGPKETVHVVITGGAVAGTYDAIGTKGGCSTGANGPGSWGNAFSTLQAKPNDIGSLSLIVPDAKAAAAGTKVFFVEVGIGPITKRTATLDVETRPNQGKMAGSGTVTVKDAGQTALVTIDAQTADGATIHATIDCKTVVRIGVE